MRRSSSPAAVERQHELCSGALAERLAGDERLELGGHRGVMAESHLGVDAILGAVEAQLGQARPLERGERLGELGQRLAAPEGEGLTEQTGGGPWVAAGQRDSSRVAQSLEPDEVDGVGLGNERVSAGPRDEHTGRQHLAQLGDVYLHHLRGRAGHVLAPEVLDEALGGDRAIGIERQPGEQRAWLATAEPHRGGSVADLERAEEERHHGDGRRCYAAVRVRTGRPAAPRTGSLPVASGDAGGDEQAPDLVLVDDLDAQLLGLGRLARADVGAADQHVGAGRHR